MGSTLVILTVLVVITALAMAICIRLILPKHFSSNEYIKENTNLMELLYKCKCIKEYQARILFNPDWWLPDGKNESIPYNQTTLVSNTTQSTATVVSESVPAHRKKRDDIDNYHEELLKNYSFVVSLTVPSYIDAPMDRRFICNGIILTYEWGLTGSACNRESIEWFRFEVRSGSVFWSKGGFRHQVIATKNLNIIKDNKDSFYLVAFKVYPPFDASPRAKPISQGRTLWDNLESVGWDIRLYDRPLRLKFAPIEIIKWTKLSCPPNEISYLCHENNDRSCYALDGRPLVTKCGHLVGMSLMGFENCVNHVNTQTRRVRDFIQSFQKKSPPENATAEYLVGTCIELHLATCIKENQDTC